MGAAELAADAVAILAGLIIVVGGVELVVRGSARIIGWVLQPYKAGDSIDGGDLRDFPEETNKDV